MRDSLMLIKCDPANYLFLSALISDDRAEPTPIADTNAPMKMKV